MDLENGPLAAAAYGSINALIIPRALAGRKDWIEMSAS
jgi:hypothetical protein